MKFPKHIGRLTIEHNAHHQYTKESLEEYLEVWPFFYDWESEEHRVRAIETDSLWTIHWYPDTPVGFIALAAPTFEELISFAEKYEGRP